MTSTRRARWWLPALVVVVAAVAVALLVGRGTPRTTGASVAGTASSAASASVAPAASATAAPRHLWIPALDLSVPLSRLGLNPDRSVQVPRDPDNVGWYRFGTVPGQTGSAVLLGHVDSDAGPAVFARLGSLRTGDRVGVEAADGRRLHFAVTSVVTYANADFPARKVYAPGGAGRRLTLVTCGGGYDARTGYLGNVVVTTRLVDPARS